MHLSIHIILNRRIRRPAFFEKEAVRSICCPSVHQLCHVLSFYSSLSSALLLLVYYSAVVLVPLATPETIVNHCQLHTPRLLEILQPELGRTSFAAIASDIRYARRFFVTTWLSVGLIVSLGIGGTLVCLSVCPSCVYLSWHVCYF